MSKYISLRMSHLNGFSLIELIIVVSITAVLAIVAIPAYNLYTNKRKVINVINILNGYRSTIAEQFIINQTCPSSISLGKLTLTSGSAYSVPSGTFKDNPISTLTYNASSSNNSGSSVQLCQLQAKVIPDLGGGQIDLQIMPNKNTGMLDVFCGFWNTSTSEIGGSSPSIGTTLRLTPSSCNRTDLSTL